MFRSLQKLNSLLVNLQTKFAFTNLQVRRENYSSFRPENTILSMIKVTKPKLFSNFPFLLRHQCHPSTTNPSPTKTLPPIEPLPPEILSVIFALCCFCEDDCQIGRFDHVPINVSQVSRRWGEIALTTPRIWSFLAYKEDRNSYLSAYRRPIMPLEIGRLWGERSKAVGLSLRFRDFPRAMYSSSDV